MRKIPDYALQIGTYLILVIVGISLKDLITKSFSIQNFLPYANGLLFAISGLIYFSVYRKWQKDSHSCPSAQSIDSLIREFRSASTYCRALELAGDARVDYMIATNELLFLESNVDAKKIVVYTPEIIMDLEDEFLSVVASNMNRGICYHYLLPENTPVRSQVRVLQDRLARKVTDINSKLTITYLPEAVVVAGVTLHMGDFNRGYLNIPNRKYERDFFIVLDDYFISRYAECIEQLSCLSSADRR